MASTKPLNCKEAKEYYGVESMCCCQCSSYDHNNGYDICAKKGFVSGEGWSYLVCCMVRDAILIKTNKTAWLRERLKDREKHV